ncbi:fucose 4-O-acetylase [Paenibacillus sp. YPG26]|uniref:acyltransferase family protein n=1 Tax=Paenibacillus sp. YPG26 TaxID=2878915 RepID=UPI00203C9E9B|nr:fucose 4-O-acetylase [Paenibacillus sp. YPG26]USB32295.1 fucose 4-O-acetylase [Paenibacillus sp. YPG26]
MKTQEEKDNSLSEVNDDTWMLNLRFVLILLVVIATGIEPVMSRFGMLEDLHAWIFIFHIPLFAFVTGYFSRHNLLGRKGLASLGSIAVHYVIFQTLYSTLDVLFFQASQQKHSFFVPYLMLWFLVAHIGWRVLLRIMCALNLKHPVLISAALGVAAGYLGHDGSWLSLSRLFVFLPFFAAGYSLHTRKLLVLCSGPSRIGLGGLSIILLAAVSLLLAWHSTPDWLYGKFTYAEMGIEGPAAALTRIGWYLLQAAGSLTFLALIPQQRSIITSLGSRTLYVFLLHGLFIRSGIRLGLYDNVRQPADLVVLAIAIVGITVILALPQTRQITKWLIEPDLGGFARMGRQLAVRWHPRRVLKKL